MGPEVWVFLGILVTAVLGVIGTAIAAYFSYKGAKYAKPTGNGFAGDVKTALADIKEHMKRQDERLARIELAQLDHLRDHAFK